MACPLHYGDTTPTGVDPRPKWLVLGEHDEIVREARIRDLTAQWRSVHTVVVPGASHFFVGRTERVVDSALEAIATLCRDSS